MNKQIKGILIGLAFATGLSFSATVLAEDHDPLKLGGYVVGVAERAGNVTIVRGGSRFGARPGTAILEGDIIIIGGNAKVNLSSNSPERSGEFDRDDSPIQFPTVPKPRPSIQDMIRELIGAIHGAKGALAGPPATVSQVPSKGPTACPPQMLERLPLEPIPALRSPEQEVAGPESVILAWRGGKPPFNIEYKLQGPWVKPAVVCQQYYEWLTSPAAVAHGSASVRVTDQSGAKIAWRITFNSSPTPSLRAVGADEDGQLLLNGLRHLNSPDGRLGIRALDDFRVLSGRSMIAWRLLQAAYAGADL